MAADENTEGGAAGAGVSASGGTSKLVIVASLVNMLATVGIMAVLVMAHQKEKSKATVEDIVSGQAHGKGHGAAHAEAKGGHGDAKGGHGEAGSGGESAVTDSGKIVPLEPFTVNLTTGIGTNPRYVRMNVSVELEQGVPDKEFEIKLPRVRDTIINLLNSKKAIEINATEGREQLKDEIKRSINGFMLQSKVKGVYFTNFAISN